MTVPTVLDNALFLASGHEATNQIPIEQIAVVAELSTAEGPFAEDYFLVVVDIQGNEYHVRGISDGTRVAELLSDSLGIPLETTLWNRTELDSRILFPTFLRGRPLFVTKYQQTSLTRWFQRLLGIENCDLRFTEEVKALLNRLN